MKKILLIALVLSSPCYLANPSYALTRYRCDGWVQFTPCQEGVKRSMFKGKGGVSSSRRIHTPTSAKIVSQEMKRVNKKEGVWRGRVYGDGNTKLFLEITQEGEVKERRYMGEVYLEKQETWFAFKSVLPSGTDWHWQVVAM